MLYLIVPLQNKNRHQSYQKSGRGGLVNVNFLSRKGFLMAMFVTDFPNQDRQGI